MSLVEYGCEHLQHLFTEKKKEAVSQYTSIQHALQEKHPLVSCTNKNVRQPEAKPLIAIGPTYLCLQCSNVSTATLRDKHWDLKGHAFSVDSKTGSLYCQNCKDFVYDPALEEVRLRKGGKKRKLNEVSTIEDARRISSNTNVAPCATMGIRGFYNAGQTCYMSAVLQCLLHNPFLRAFYLGGCHLAANCDRENCISCSLDDIFTDFYGIEKYEGYGIQNFLFAIWKESELMAGYKQQDAHEFFQFILDALHNHNTESGDANGADSPESSGTTSDSSNCTCVIHSTFFGKLQSTVTCEKCHNTNTTFDPFMDLSLDLPIPSTAKQTKKIKLTTGSASATSSLKEKKIKDEDEKDSKDKDKDKEKGSQPDANVVISPVELKDCLVRFTGKESLNPGEYTCSKCKSIGGGATKQLSIRKLPPVVPIHLKRFEHSLSSASKIEGRVKFPMRLDLLPYTTRYKHLSSSSSNKPTNGTSSQSPSSPTPSSPTSPSNPSAASLLFSKSASACIYELYGVIVHKGSGVDNGHYVAYVRCDGREWFRFDDSKVAVVSEAEVLGAEAYLLFYMIRFLEEG